MTAYGFQNSVVSENPAENPDTEDLRTAGNRQTDRYCPEGWEEEELYFRAAPRSV